MPEDEHSIIRRYLLQDVDAAAADALEARLLTDGDFFDRVTVVEDELIEDYVRGRVPPHERHRVERFLANPHRQRQLTLTRALVARFDHATPSSESPAATANRASTVPARGASWPIRWVPLAAAASLVVSMASSGYLWVRTTQLQDQLSSVGTRSNDTTTATVVTTPIESFVLTAERAVRSGGRDRTQVALQGSTPAVEFQLPVASVDGEPFRVQVERPGGVQVWGAAAVSTPDDRRPVIVIAVPRAVLSPDDYVVRVFSASGDVVDDFRFRILRDEK